MDLEDRKISVSGADCQACACQASASFAEEQIDEPVKFDILQPRIDADLHVCLFDARKWFAFQATSEYSNARLPALEI